MTGVATCQPAQTRATFSLLCPENLPENRAHLWLADRLAPGFDRRHGEDLAVDVRRQQRVVRDLRDACPRELETPSEVTRVDVRRNNPSDGGGAPAPDAADVRTSSPRSALTRAVGRRANAVRAQGGRPVPRWMPLRCSARSVRAPGAHVAGTGRGGGGGARDPTRGCGGPPPPPRVATA